MRSNALLAAMLLAASTGCESITPATCDPSPAANPAQLYTGGQTEDGVYMSSPWDSGLLYFPGGMQYSLVHGLGRTPDWEYTYLSFESTGVADGGLLAQAAGNQAVILGMNAQTIDIANDSCVPYWVLVTAGATSNGP